MAPKLGPVPPAPAPLDPFKTQVPPALGVVVSNEVTARAPQGPTLGVVDTISSRVVSVAPPVPETIGQVNQPITPAPAPIPAPPPVGIVEDNTPVYPPPSPGRAPAIGQVTDLSITPPRPSPEAEEATEAPQTGIVQDQTVIDPSGPSAPLLGTVRDSTPKKSVKNAQAPSVSQPVVVDPFEDKS